MTLKHSVPHDLELELAQKAVTVALDSYAQKFSQYAPRVSWIRAHSASISFRVKNVSLEGTVDVNAGAILIDLKVPFVLRVFKGKAIEIIEREIKVWLDKARAGELDG
ncbi:MAG: hypothetical protein CMH52_09180 [Myxococcales bacterium]|mgnify:CR=1 FL=1|nr:hypothetical protein [Myxococcales bacterium]|tara:strand:+ start:198 stop:521 length:324 start_codon:yes stop_codon:yes gene_type:complete